MLNCGSLGGGVAPKQAGKNIVNKVDRIEKRFIVSRYIKVERGILWEE